MKVKILRGFCLTPGVDVAPGDVAEVDDGRARYLFQTGKAAPYAEPPAPVAEDQPTKPRPRKPGREGDGT